MKADKKGKKVNFNKNERQIIRIFMGTILLCLTFTISISVAFVTNFLKNQTIQNSTQQLDNLRKNVDKQILRKLDEFTSVIVKDIIYSSELNSFFVNGIDGNTFNIKLIYDYLRSKRGENDLISSIYIYYAQNNVVITTNGITYLDEETNTGLMNKDWVTLLNEKKNEEVFQVVGTISNPDYKTPHQLKMVIFTRRIPLKNYVGGIAVFVEESRLYENIIATAPNSLNGLLILDESNHLVSGYNNAQLPEELRDYDFNRNGYSIERINGERCVVSVALSQYNRWRYVDIKPIYKYTYMSRYVTQILLFMLVFAIIPAFFITLVSTKKVYDPVRKIVNIAKGYHHESNKDAAISGYELIDTTLRSLGKSVSEYKEKIDENLNILKYNFIHNLLYEDDTISLIQKKRQAELLKLDFDECEYVVFIVENVCPYVYEDVLESQYYQIVMVEAIESVTYKNSCRCICSGFNGNVVGIAYNQRITENEYRVFEDINKEMMDKVKQPFRISVGNVVKSMNDVPQSYQNALCMFEKHFMYPGNHIEYFSDLFLQNVEENKLIADNLIKNICAGVDLLNLDHFNNAFDALLNNSQKMDMRYHEIRRIQQLIWKEIASKILEDPLNTSIMQDFEEKYDNVFNIHEFRGLVSQMIQYLQKADEKQKNDVKKELIENVQKYILENVCNNLTLHSIAKEFNISPNYLSILFKKIAGISYVEFIVQAKMNVGRDLIENSDMLVSEVAEKIGYSNSQYFISAFKKIYGFTPKNYKIYHKNK